ncbi:right-handed parallel beta-helix repeat-containing protein [Brevibacillus sp. HB2.2]|uniref:right-handed parallel beta-helix repeat-containing protein n=1 Tax=Brevibacillus sp. HB2.2 TaxID=2738846 RepID=UPI00156B8B22|nr:right-handed parallel beta-helix repeat-containing protein [Brevibacillus sp. HB2.2]NRS47836.1 right-handed parallel beta-helix repeat-containing protein [Brevibacillus sp. HB2.2]
MDDKNSLIQRDLSGGIGLFGAAANPSGQVINVKDYPKEEGETTDSPAIKRALADADIQKCPVFFPAGTYIIDQTILIPEYVSIYGVGYHSKILASKNGIKPDPDEGTKYLKPDKDGNYPMIKFSIKNTKDIKNISGNRYGVMSQLFVDGAGVAKVGVDLAYVTVERTFMAIEIENVNGPAIRLDASQNNTFISVNIEKCRKGIELLNGAGNNAFYRCEINESTEVGIEIGANKNLYGYKNNAYSDTPEGNDFQKCIVERGSARYGIKIINGKRNTFWNCDVTTGDVAKVYIEDKTTVENEVVRSSSLNSFYRCQFVGSKEKAILAFDSRAFRTVIEDCIFEGFIPGSEIIHVYNETHIRNNHFAKDFGDPDHKIVNKAGSNNYNVIFQPIVNRGSTKLRPKYHHMGAGVYYFDTDMGKPLFLKDSQGAPVWVDGTGAEK